MSVYHLVTPVGQRQGSNPADLAWAAGSSAGRCSGVLSRDRRWVGLSMYLTPPRVTSSTFSLMVMSEDLLSPREGSKRRRSLGWSLCALRRSRLLMDALRLAPFGSIFRTCTPAAGVNPDMVVRYGLMHHVERSESGSLAGSMRCLEHVHGPAVDAAQVLAHACSSQHQLTVICLQHDGGLSAVKCTGPGAMMVMHTEHATAEGSWLVCICA